MYWAGNDFNGSASGEEAIDAMRLVLHEKEKTRRMVILAACFFLVFGGLIMVFSPAGKETVGYIVGAALVVMALGAIGVAQLKIKAPGIEIEGAGGHVPVLGASQSSGKPPSKRKVNIPHSS